MRNVIASAALLLSLAVAAIAPASAAPFVSKTAGMSIELPAGYQAKTKGDVFIHATDATGDVEVTIVVVEPDAKKAFALADKKLAEDFTAIKWSKPMTSKINGVPGVMRLGSGQRGGKPVDLAVVLVAPTPRKKGVLVAAVVDHDKMDAHKTELAAIVDSLKPAH